MLATPGFGILISTGLEPLLNEQYLGVVICVLRKYMAAASPWRDDKERNAIAWADRSVAGDVVRILDPLAFGSGCSVEGSNMITEATLFVVADHENDLVIGGTLCDCIHDLVDEPAECVSGRFLNRLEKRSLTKHRHSEDMVDARTVQLGQ